MTTGLLPKTALAALAATALFLPFGAPLPGSCVRAIGVAGAAPSPSCGGDLRECLRASADMRQTAFGGRYVTADDVALCMDAFRSCISGGAGRVGAPPASTPDSSGNGSKELPQAFRIDSVWGPAAGLAYDCRVSGEAVSCTLKTDTLSDRVDSYTGEFTGTLQGLTMTGTETRREVAHATETSCASVIEDSGPFSAVLALDGTANVRSGPTQRRTTVGGSCSGSWDQTLPESETQLSWSKLG